MKIAIFGASGFAREVADICAAIGYAEIVLLDLIERPEGTVNGLRVVSEDEVEQLAESGFDFAIGIADPIKRELIAKKHSDFNFPNIIHPSVIMGVGQSDLLSLSKGIVSAAGVILTNNVSVGDFCIFNLSVTLGHDTSVEEYVSVMPGANISGNVLIRKGAYLGTGCVVLQGVSETIKLEIGQKTVVGAGAVVTKSIESDVVVVGSPARAI